MKLEAIKLLHRDNDLVGCRVVGSSVGFSFHINSVQEPVSLIRHRQAEPVLNFDCREPSQLTQLVPAVLLQSVFLGDCVE